MNSLVVLVVLACFSFNPVFELCLGINEVLRNTERSIKGSFFQWVLMFITIFLCWLLFAFILRPLNLVFFEYFLLFPLTVLMHHGFDWVLLRLFPGSNGQSMLPSPYSSYAGLTLAAIILTLHLAGTVASALVLSLCFPFSAFCSLFLLRMMKTRVQNEKIAPIFRKTPLMLISMGLLSLVFSSVAFILLNQGLNR